MSFSPNSSQEFVDLIEIFSPEIIVEVGSWYGASAVGFLQLAEQRETKVKMICVDTWLGSNEHWLNWFPNSPWDFESLRISAGEPRILEQFWENIRSLGFESQVSIVRAPSEIGLPYLHHIGTEADMVYIDGDHAFSAVMRDIRLSRAIQNPRGAGVICGDDWGWPSVRRAVIISALKNRERIFFRPRTSTWIILQRNTHHGTLLMAKGWQRLKYHELPKFFFLPQYKKFSRLWKVLRNRVRRKLVDPIYKSLVRNDRKSHPL